MDLHVSNLPFKLKENQLKELFEAYGEVTAVKIVIDHKTRLSKGYGFVTFAKLADAEKALAATIEVQERTLKVAESMPTAKGTTTKPMNRQEYIAKLYAEQQNKKKKKWDYGNKKS